MFFAAVLVGDFPALEQEERRRFADMGDAIKLILRDALGVLTRNGFVVFKFFFYADNHLVFSWQR